MRRKGPADISYCNTFCDQSGCERNLRFFQPPEKFYSVSSFDTEDKDTLHTKCIHKLAKDD